MDTNDNTKHGGLIPARIDYTNIVADFIFNDLFDDEVYTHGESEALGYIHSIPSFARCAGNKLEIRFVQYPIRDYDVLHWAHAIRERTTGVEDDSSEPGSWLCRSAHFLGGKSSDGQDMVLTSQFTKDDGVPMVTIRYYFSD